MNIIIYR